MTPKLEQDLMKRFPILYQDKDKPATESLMCFGFCCDDGWEPIIRELSGKLEAMNHLIAADNIQIKAVQVKEKFGGLRFYVDVDSPKDVSEEKLKQVYALIKRPIAKAENESYEVCEVCSQKGSPRGKSWVKTLCDTCDNKRKGN
jgi:hypothetical protein